jgi:hypothetical protein
VNDPKISGYQLTVIGQSRQAKKTVQFIPADTSKVSCRDSGAGHEGLWDVTVQSCNRDIRHHPSVPAECFLLAKRVSFQTEGRVNTTRQYQEYEWSSRLKERDLYNHSLNITLQ